MRMPRSVLILAALSVPHVVSAQVSQTVGSGTAVTTVQASADFENQAALNGNPYVENGLSFSRTGMTFNNNGCGFAGCNGNQWSGMWQGNFMYGTGATGSYFSMFLTGGQTFSGLEFQVGSGFWTQNAATVGWEAYFGGGLLSSGSAALTQGDVVGFSSATGFDELRYFTTNGTQNTAAFDQVRAEFTSVSVPEPSALILMLSGMFGLGLVALRRRYETQV